jgi:RNA polymerase-binding transcription factor DksA
MEIAGKIESATPDSVQTEGQLVRSSRDKSYVWGIFFRGQDAVYFLLVRRLLIFLPSTSEEPSMQTSELQAYKTELLTLRARISRELNHMIEAIPEEIQAAGNLSNLPTHNADRDSDGLDKEVALLQNEEGLLEAVNAALERIEQGVFGLCSTCQTPISHERLQALPYAPLCIKCAQREVRV